MIAQHHGTTRIEYFYRKALEEAVATGASINESDFRYPGPRPKTKEAGILMLADSIEATVKSLEKPTPKRIEDIVHGTIRAKLEDGQFDQCELTMHEIHETGEAILDRKSTRLNSSHANISYAVFCLKKKKTSAH